MRRELHVRICESGGVRFPSATRPPMPVLDPGRGRTKRGHLWSYVRDDRGSGGHDPPAVWFAYSPDRKGLHPQRHLRGFKGLLQTDAYAGFDVIAERAPRASQRGGRARRVLCLGHARRHFHDLHVAVGSPIALEVLERIGKLYGIERRIKGCTPPERYRVRQAESVPHLQALHVWLSDTLLKVSKSSELAKAIVTPSRVSTGRHSRTSARMVARR